MAMRDRSLEHGEISGFLDEGTDFEGNLRFRDTMRIDGRFRGSISSKSVLIVGESADIKGEVTVSNVSINGRVNGKIIADKKIEIHSKGRVFGDITTPNLVIEDGAFFNGNCNMESTDAKKGEKTAAPLMPPSPPKPEIGKAEVKDEDKKSSDG